MANVKIINLSIIRILTMAINTNSTKFINFIEASACAIRVDHGEFEYA